MRTLYVQDIQNDQIMVMDEQHHHLTNVLRAKEGQEIQLLNGKGESALSRIAKISKKQTQLSVIDRAIHDRCHNISIAIAQTKKDALCLSLKQAVELGVERIILFHSEFSQDSHMKEDRIKSVLISALEQSESKFMPEIVYCELLEKLPLNNFENVLIFDLEGQENVEISQNNTLVIIGPEGGFSQNDRDFFDSKNLSKIRMKTNILRAPTAVSAAMGFTLGKMV
jgi:16S rRNA (uracil1498-N3)-methyltransferase